MRLKVFLCLALVCLLGLPVLAADKGTVTIGLERDIDAMTPFQSKSGYPIPIHTAIYEHLVRPVTATGEWVPWLAESVTLMPNNKDIMVTLRKDAVFHNGDPVTAEDVKFSYELFVAKDNVSAYRSYFKRMKDIEIIDDHTLKIIGADPNVDWFRPFQVWAVASKKYYEKVGPEVFYRHPMGSGPFEFVGRKIGESIELKAVKGYKMYPAHVDRLVFRVVTDAVTRAAMLETGALDMIANVPPHDMQRMMRSKDIKIKKAQVPSYFGVGFNTVKYPDLLNQDMRLAFNYAVNRQELVDTLFLGFGYPLYCFGSKAEIGYDPSLVYPYDPAKAKELVARSGYEGQPISITYTSQFPNGPEVFSAIQGYLRAVGINATIQNMEAGAFNALAVKKSEQLMAGNTAWPGRRDPSNRLALGVRTGGMFTVFSGNPVFDELISEQEKIFDEKERVKVLKKLNRKMFEDPGYLSLFGLEMIYALRDRVDYTWVKGYNRFVNLDEIKIVK